MKQVQFDLTSNIMQTQQKGQSQSLTQQSKEQTHAISTIHSSFIDYQSYQSQISGYESALNELIDRTGITIKSNFNHITGFEKYGIVMGQMEEGSLMIDVQLVESRVQEKEANELQKISLQAKNAQLQTIIEQLEKKLFTIQQTQLKQFTNKIQTLQQDRLAKIELIDQLEKRILYLQQRSKQGSKSEIPDESILAISTIQKQVQNQISKAPSKPEKSELSKDLPKEITTVLCQSFRLKEVIRQVPVYIEKQIILQIPVYIEKIIQVQREIIREVPVPIFYDKNGSQIKKSLRSLFAQSETFRFEIEDSLNPPIEQKLSFRKTQSVNEVNSFTNERIELSKPQKAVKKYSLDNQQMQLLNGLVDPVRQADIIKESFSESVQKEQQSSDHQRLIQYNPDKTQQTSQAFNQYNQIQFVSCTSQKIDLDPHHNNPTNQEILRTKRSQPILVNQQFNERHTLQIQEQTSDQFKSLDCRVVQVEVEKHILYPILIVQPVLVPIVRERDEQKRPLQDQIQRQEQHKMIEKVIIRQVPVYLTKQVQKQVIVQQPIQIIKQIPIIREIPIYIQKEVKVIERVPQEVPKYTEVIKTVQILIEIPAPILIITKVQHMKQIQKQTQVIKELIVMKQVIIQMPVIIIKEVPIIIVKEIIVQKPINVVEEVQVIRQIIKEVQVIRQVVKEVQVIRQVVKEVQVIRQVVKEVQVIRVVEVPIEIIREILVLKEIQKPIEIVREVQVLQTVELIKEVPIEVIRQVYRQIEVIKQIFIERIQQRNNPIDKLRNLQDGQSPDRSNNESSEWDGRDSDQFFNHQSPQNNQRVSPTRIDNDQQTRQINKLSQQSRMVIEENTYLKQKIVDLTNNIYYQNQNYKEIGQQLQRKTKDFQKLKMELSIYQKDRNTLKEIQWVERLEKQQKFLKQLNQKVVKLEEGLQNEKNSRKLAEKELKQIQTQCGDLYQSQRQKNIRHKQQIRIVQAQLQTKDQKILQLNHMNHQFENLFKKTNHQLQQAYKKANQAQQEVLSLRQQLERTDREDQRFSEPLSKQRYSNMITSIQERYQSQIKGLRTIYENNLINLKQKINLLQIQLDSLKDENSVLRSDTLSRQIDTEEIEPVCGRQIRQNIFHYPSSKMNSVNSRQKHSEEKRSKITIRQFQNQSLQQSYIRELMNKSDVQQNMEELQNNYQQVIDEQNYQIIKLKELIYQYQKVIINHQSAQNHYFPKSQRQFHAFGFPRYHTEMNEYISKILNQLSQTEETLTAEKAQKRRLQAIIKTVQTENLQQVLRRRHNTFSQQKNAHSFGLLRNDNDYRNYQQAEEDSVLLEQMISELEIERSKNEKYKQRVCILNQQVKRLHKVLQKRHEEQYDRKNLSSPRSVNGQNQHTIIQQQLKVYKSQYYNLLEINKDLRRQIKDLKDKFNDVNTCVKHLEAITSLSKKIQNYEQNVIPELKGELRSAREASTSNIQMLRHSQIDSQRPTIELPCSIISFCQIDKKSDISSPRYNNDISLDVIIKSKKLETVGKYIISLKIIEFAIEYIEKNAYQSFCPQKIIVLNYDCSNPNTARISKTLLTKKKMEQLKYYQAPQVLRGEKQTQKSMTWNLGMIIHEMFRGRPFYAKFVDIFTRTQNYSFAQIPSNVGYILERMIIKDRAMRIDLSECHQAFKKLISDERKSI